MKTLTLLLLSACAFSGLVAMNERGMPSPEELGVAFQRMPLSQQVRYSRTYTEHQPEIPLPATEAPAQ